MDQSALGSGDSKLFAQFLSPEEADRSSEKQFEIRLCVGFSRGFLIFFYIQQSSYWVFVVFGLYLFIFDSTSNLFFCAFVST